MQTIINEFKVISKLYENELKNSKNQDVDSPKHCKDIPWISCSESSSRFILLNYSDRSDSENFLFKQFDQLWSFKIPIVIKDVHHRLNSDLWTPQSFMNKYGDLTVDLINCKNNDEYQNVKMKKFWLGLENFYARL